MIICIIGPDGAGKSTIIDELRSRNVYKISYYHLRPVKASGGDRPCQVTDPHGQVPYTMILSYLKLLYLLLQYNLGWMKNIMFRDRHDRLIIFDRYFDDLYLDPLRFRFGGSVAIVRMVRVFIPRPTRYFVLLTTAEIIMRRKQEVPEAELKRQLEAYAALIDGKRYFGIDAGKSPKSIVDEILGKIQ